jgi:predicted pyridoxine 5'-phosphate oxidase superfamily flavin-nucleotide-binding protein
VTPAEILELIRRYRMAVVSTAAADGAPQAAVVGIAVSEKLEIVFDTLASTRKHQNLRRDPPTPLVTGWDGELTFQIEGTPDFPTGEELQRMTTSTCTPPIYPCTQGWASYGLPQVRRPIPRC